MSASPQPSAASYFDGYRPLPGVADEVLDAQGRMRPVWQRFLAQYGALTPAELATRFERANQYLRDAGVYFRTYSNTTGTEREWPLSHLPVLLHESEWDGICAGLTQRADLLEQVLADLYGPRDLIRNGHLPARLIAESPEWLRPMVGVRPAGGHFLQVAAFELCRSPDGSWLVLGDRVQAPSGAGFALENRMATGRIFPEDAIRRHVHRLAGFFEDFRDALRALAQEAAGPEASAAILTPGRSNDTYFEQTYIARYLGLLLLEGEDLLVQGGTAQVRTIEGPRPIGALWRRMDAAYADPLELDAASQIGTPGLMQAVRGGRLGMANALGSGIVEMRAMMAFLPRICEVLTGAPLILPNIATWWCGGEAERAVARREADRMLFGRALGTSLPYDTDPAPLRPDDRGKIAEWIDTQGGALVAQEAVALSTTPAWIAPPDAPMAEGRIAPRPMTIRVFAARTDKGWRFMHGGYARIGRHGEATALAMQQGGSVADVWIMSDGDVEQKSLHPTPGRAIRQPYAAVVPSRAADNLFWLGRYVERTEDAIRLVRAYHLRLATTDNAGDPVLRRLRAYLAGFGIDAEQPMPEGLLQRIAAARSCASKVRDRFSVDGWAALTDLEKTASEQLRHVSPGDDAARAMFVLVRKVTGFSGLVHHNMYRFKGWRFLTLGQALERADGLAALLHGLAGEDAPEGSLDLAIEVADSVITHRRRYAVQTTRETVHDLLALDPDNPRSILFQLRIMRDQVAALPVVAAASGQPELTELLDGMDRQLCAIEPGVVDGQTLLAIRANMAGLSDLVASLYLH